VVVVVVVVVSSSCRPAAERLPDEQRHDRVRVLLAVAAGSCEITTPSKVSTSVSCFVTCTLNPAAFSGRGRILLRLAVTSGSGDVCGPFETDRLTVEPFVAVDDPLGTCDVTTRRLRALDVRARDGEAGGLELLERRRVVEADDGRHGHLLRPVE
jgi:hypothetical protein